MQPSGSSSTGEGLPPGSVAAPLPRRRHRSPGPCLALHLSPGLRATCRASGRLAEAPQENTEATDADLLRQANPFLAKLLLTHLAGDEEAERIAGGQFGSNLVQVVACGRGQRAACCTQCMEGTRDGWCACLR